MKARSIWSPNMLDVDAFVATLEVPAWQRDAACVEHPEVEFFPERGKSTKPAKAVCQRCIVRDECLDYAIEHGLQGIWGGTSVRQREALTGERLSYGSRGLRGERSA